MEKLNRNKYIVNYTDRDKICELQHKLDRLRQFIIATELTVSKKGDFRAPMLEEYDVYENMAQKTLDMVKQNNINMEKLDNNHCFFRWNGDYIEIVKPISRFKLFLLKYIMGFKNKRPC